MKSNLIGAIVATAVILLLGAYGSLFTVYQTKQALVVRLGEPVRVITEPGLQAKWPLIETASRP